MKFGIFYELQLPRPWGADSELILYHNALDQHPDVQGSNWPTASATGPPGTIRGLLQITASARPVARSA